MLQALFPPLPLPHPPYGYAPFFPGRRIGAAASPLSSRQPRPNQQESPPPPEQLPNFHSSPLLLSLTSFFSPLVRFVISSVPSAFEGRWERGGSREAMSAAGRPAADEGARRGGCAPKKPPPLERTPTGIPSAAAAAAAAAAATSCARNGRRRRRTVSVGGRCIITCLRRSPPPTKPHLDSPGT